MIRLVVQLEVFLETLNRQRDELLYPWLRQYWPRSITPNQLSVFRIGLGIALFLILFGTRYNSAIIILPLFFVGILTDLLDGSIARGLRMETSFGAFIDPIADRILIIPVAVYSLIADHKILLILIIFFETINALISIYTRGKKIFFGSNIFGKTKMVIQSVVFLAILIFWPYAPHFFFIGLLWVSVVLTIMSIGSKISYIKIYYDQEKAKAI